MRMYLSFNRSQSKVLQYQKDFPDLFRHFIIQLLYSHLSPQMYIFINIYKYNQFNFVTHSVHGGQQKYP